MKPSFLNKNVKRLIILLVAIAAIYGSGRLYYKVTAGFVESNIKYDLPYNPKWELTALDSEEQKELNRILSQDYHYLGKGCQSYVFNSQDDQYVIKFFKYQRFRPQAWLDYFAFIPAVDDYRLRKIEKKKCKLENVFSSWKLAYEDLKTETGVVFVQLNKREGSNPNFVIYDKMGLKHTLNLNELEFMVQKKAKMLCPSLLKCKEDGNFGEAQEIINKLFAMILSEYERGYADNDHALMQNTGVYEGKPIHIDVGQFVKNPIVTDAKVYQQELFNKTFKFRIWLKKHYPELAEFTEKKL